VRLVGENIENPGVFSIEEARRLADELELDLVMISDKADPPVCRIIDYQKFLYQQKKKQRKSRPTPRKLSLRKSVLAPTPMSMTTTLS
jgi:translation initiation factor IF-3